MSQQDSIKKEVVIRGVLASLIDVQGAPPIDPGELVIFLEKEANHWCDGQSVELTPLWYFCVHRKQWTEFHFERLCQSLRQLFSYHSILWTPPDTNKSAVFIESPSIDEPMPAVSTPRSSEEELHAALELLTPSDSVHELPQPTPFQEELTPQFATRSVSNTSDKPKLLTSIPQQTQIIHWIVSAVQQSPIQDVIDPSKLEEFLQHALVDMWEQGTLHLQELWSLLAEPEEVTNDMLVRTFLLLELNFSKQSLGFPINWPPLLKGLGVSQRIAILKSMGLEPPASWSSPTPGSLSPVGTSANSGTEAKTISRSDARSDAKTSMNLQNSNGSSEKKKSSGSLTAFAGHSTGSIITKEAEPSTKSPRTKKTDSGKTTKSSTSSGPRTTQRVATAQGISVPRWLAMIAVMLVVASVGYYLMFGPVSLSGQPMNVRAYSEYVPLHDLRILGTTVQAMPRSSFFLDSESVQQSKLHLLYTHIKNNNGFVTGMAIYSLRGKFLKNYIPPQPPKIKKATAARRETP